MFSQIKVVAVVVAVVVVVDNFSFFIFVRGCEISTLDAVSGAKFLLHGFG